MNKNAFGWTMWMVTGLWTASALGQPDAAEAPPPARASASALAPAQAAVERLGSALFAAQLAAQPSGSVLFAPVNLQAGLAQLALAAEGETATAMAAAWGLAGAGNTPALVQGLAAAERAASHSAQPETIVVHSAAALWLAGNLLPKASYRRQLREFFGLMPERIDFARPDAAATINAWCYRVTQGFIPRAVDQVPAAARLLLANAFYFRAPWQQPFDRAETRSETFAAPGGSKTVPFLHSLRTLPVADLNGLRAVWLPFAGGEYSLAVILPDGDARAWAAASQPADWMALKDAASYKRRSVMLALPKLDLEAGQSMNTALAAAGLAAVFADNANFKGLGAAVPLAEISQRVHLRLDEAGAEAAAVSTVLAVRGGGEAPAEFVANRPFLLMLVHAATGLTLLQALIESP